MSAFAESQFTLRFMLFFISFSILALITSMADIGAPMVVRKSSICSLFLKYSRRLPLRSASFGEKPISSSTEYASRLTL